ncbi:MAG TPA: ATP-binding protein, partial [Candidatus Wallbacteria bacterium]|nr:ATP-binding protein [Candidatus Wallbacteria bacterium]
MNEGAALHKIVYGAGGKAENYIIIDINKQYEKIIGLKKEDVAGKTSTEVYKVPVPPYLEEFTSVARDNKTFQFETYFAPMDKYFLISVFSFEADHFATIFFDITANKLAELEREKFIKELESKNAELERFTYTVSHDLKSPLITIKGFLGMLDSDMARGDEKRIKSDIKRIADAADKMAFLLDDLLELSRIGRIINPPKLFPLGELVSEVAELLSSTIAASRASIKTAGELPSVFGDRKRIFEVIQNLVENAIKFKRDDADPEIEIGAKSSGDSTIVYVRDNGIGIESKYFENVFGLFNKLNTSSAGTGIGLAL